MSDCNGACVRASDIGVPVAGDPVAYAHPACPEHGDADYCEHCQGWGNFAAREPEANRLMCPMCDGTGVRTRTPAEAGPDQGAEQ